METWACRACGGENPEGTRFCGHCGSPQGQAEPQVSDELLRGLVDGRIGQRLAEAGGELPHERRLITALFADVSGFTTLADQLEPEALLEVIDPVIAGLSSVVKDYEGYIEKFAGDALLALFGAPISHEDDAERALLAAIEMHRKLDEIVAELPHEADLTLHVGVNSGHGIGRILDSEARADYAVLGDSVILAQRLESAAPQGETYVSELTYELTRHRFELAPIGELTLKGKTEPVLAWRLLRERHEPTTRIRTAPGALVGRDDELSALITVLDGVARGGGGTVTVTGDAGIGKSRLTQEARTIAEDRSMRWLEARCLSYGAALPYSPFADLLRRLAGLAGDETKDEARALVEQAYGNFDGLPYFLRLLGFAPADADVMQLEPGEFRRRLHLAFSEWLTELASGRPTVLSLEDVHWVDSSTLELTGEVAHLAREIGVVLYLVGRPEARDVLRDIADDAVRLELGPLSEAQVGAVISSMLGGAAPRQLPRIIQHHTGGNPFFVQELLRSLQETGVLTRRNGVWAMDAGWEPRELPPTLELVLAARIDLLPLTVVQTLQTASVIGRRVPMPLIRAIASDLPDLDVSLEELWSAGFLDRPADDGDMLVFHHALVQDVAYGQLLRRRRREIHLRVAEAAEALYGAGDDTVDLLARHLYLGGADERAVPYLLRAGERSRTLFANDEAIVHLRHAVEIAPSNVEARLELGDVLELVGDLDDALAEFGRVRDATGDVRAWYGSALTLRKRGLHREALETIDNAFATPRLKGQDQTPLWLERGRTLSVLGRNDEAIEAMRAGLEAAPSRTEPVVGQLLVQLARLEVLEGEYAPALEHALEAERIFRNAGDLRMLATVLRVLCSVYFSLGRVDEAVEAGRRGLELAERVGNAEEFAGCLVNLGYLEKRRGDYDAAIRYARQAVEEFERIGLEFGRATAYANLAGMLEESNQLDEALEYCRKTEEIALAIGHPHSLADAYNTMACVERKRESFVAAGLKAEEAATLYLRVGDETQAREVLDLAAGVWERAGEEERARDCSSRARELTAV